MIWSTVESMNNWIEKFPLFEKKRALSSFWVQFPNSYWNSFCSFCVIVWSEFDKKVIADENNGGGTFI